MKTTVHIAQVRPFWVVYPVTAGDHTPPVFSTGVWYRTPQDAIVGKSAMAFKLAAEHWAQATGLLAFFLAPWFAWWAAKAGSATRPAQPPQRRPLAYYHGLSREHEVWAVELAPNQWLVGEQAEALGREDFRYVGSQIDGLPEVVQAWAAIMMNEHAILDRCVDEGFLVVNGQPITVTTPADLIHDPDVITPLTLRDWNTGHIATEEWTDLPARGAWGLYEDLRGASGVQATR